MRRLFGALILGLATALPAGAADLVLRAADTHPYGYPTVQSVQHMGELLAQSTGGRIRISMYPGRQLGEEWDTLEQTVFGAVDINRVFLAALQNVAPETIIPSLPFLFRSEEHRDHVLYGPVGDEILASLEPFGLIGLTFYESGSRNFYNTRRPILTPDDLQGMRIRVPNSDMNVAMIELLGGNATPLELGQVYEALRNGTVDGAENNWPSYADTRHFEVAPYYSLTGHSMTPEILVMSKLTWDKLTPEDQARVRQAARESARYMATLWALKGQATRRMTCRTEKPSAGHCNPFTSGSRARPGWPILSAVRRKRNERSRYWQARALCRTGQAAGEGG